jgi:hypothetical protein
LNNAVQWGRERFNETLEKADFVKSKVPPSHAGSNSAPEKLIYDRALEMVCFLSPITRLSLAESCCCGK